MTESRDPTSLVNGVLSILDAYEQAALQGGVHVHTVRRQLETALAAYRHAAESGDTRATEEAREAMNRRAADALKRLAEASMLLLTEERDRALANIAAMEKELKHRKRRHR
jgi:acyl-CoA reductase-like NAD-dependent aldehyde dehydrogenase